MNATSTVFLKPVSGPSNSQPALAAALEVIQQGRVLYKVISDEGDCPPTADDVRLPLSIVTAGAEAAKIASNDLSKEGEDREQVLEEERTRLQDLEERLTLRELMPAIEGYVQAAEWANRCTLYLRSFQGIKAEPDRYGEACQHRDDESAFPESLPRGMSITPRSHSNTRIPRS